MIRVALTGVLTKSGSARQPRTCIAPGNPSVPIACARVVAHIYTLCYHQTHIIISAISHPGSPAHAPAALWVDRVDAL